MFWPYIFWPKLLKNVQISQVHCQSFIFNSFLLFFQILTLQWINCRNLKDELDCSHNGGGVVYLLQSGAIHFNLTVESFLDHNDEMKLTLRNKYISLFIWHFRRNFIQVTEETNKLYWSVVDLRYNITTFQLNNKNKLLFWQIYRHKCFLSVVEQK